MICSTIVLAFLLLTTQASALSTASQAEASAPFSTEKKDALEDEFFDLMWLCDSPVDQERDDAQAELTRRFDEFEPVWKDRTFLTDGEIADESRRRFERAEKDFWSARLERARSSFDVKLNVEPPEGEGDAAPRRANVRVSWRVPLRVVWLAPDLRSFLWRDPETNRFWRPRSIYSSPELQPEFNADQVEFDLYLEPFPDDAAFPEEAPASAFAFDALAGVDPVPLSLPLSEDDAETREFRSGELALRVFPVKRGDDGRQTVSLRLDYDSAFDAFDSHRTWREPDDFILASPCAARVRPDAIRVRDRRSKGELLELSFAPDPAIDAAFRQGDAALVCRFPRFFVRLRIER